MNKDAEESMKMILANTVGKHFESDESLAKLEKAFTEIEDQLIKTNVPIGQKLDAFRKDMGEDHYKVIAESPNLIPMLEKWEEEAAKRNTELLIKTVRAALPPNNQVTNEDIQCFLEMVKK